MGTFKLLKCIISKGFFLENGEVAQDADISIIKTNPKSVFSVVFYCFRVKCCSAWIVKKRRHSNRHVVKRSKNSL